jgi:hypothetical protein
VCACEREGGVRERQGERENISRNREQNVTHEEQKGNPFQMVYRE